MIFNYVIYGNVTNGDDPVTSGSATLTYYNKSLDTVLSKQYFISDKSMYVFNIGDSDLLSPNGKLDQDDIFILEIYDSSSNKLYSTGFKPNLSDYFYELDIDISGFSEIDASANFTTEHKIQILDIQAVSDSNSNIISSYNLYLKTGEDSSGNAIYELKNSYYHNNILVIPDQSGEYKLEENSINITTNELSKKETTFISVGSSAMIESLDFYYYCRLKKFIKIDLPTEVVVDKNTLPDGWELRHNDRQLFGELLKLAPVVIQHNYGKIIVKPQVGVYV